MAGQSTGGLLKDAEVRRLGNRDFLVGGYLSTGDTEDADWKGCVLWVPLESVDLLMVFEDLAKAKRIAQRGRGQQPPVKS